MANSTPWAERSGAERRQTYGRFALVYGAITLVALLLGFFVIAIVFGLGTAGLTWVWYATPATAPETPTEREKPDWMKAMEDPDAPDLSLPEYRGTSTPGAVGDRSPFDRPEAADEPGPVNDPPADPPSPTI